MQQIDDARLCTALGIPSPTLRSWISRQIIVPPPGERRSWAAEPVLHRIVSAITTQVLGECMEGRFHSPPLCQR